MGVVWAVTNQHTGKRVALKAIRRSFAADSDAAKLFRHEALVASRVNHPNVVSVFDVIDHESMTCIVMELLDGEPLNEYLAREGPLSMERTAALLLPAMRGVAAANAQGVIHRDLKPHNIFLCMGHDGRVVTAKVLDFGSSLLKENALDSSVAAGQLASVGTPAYMAPEHIQGAPRIDERVDVYGFGVVFFEAMAGQHPFSGSPGSSLLIRILHEPSLSLSSLRPDLPPAVVHIIECAMAKDPSKRFPNLDPFIRLVEDHLMLSSPLPKNMTPLAGVPVFPLMESNSGVADAVVQVSRRTEDSALHETQALYTLLGGGMASAGETSPARIKLNRDEQKTPMGDTSVDKLPTLGQALRRFFANPVMGGMAFCAILIFVIWVAFPMPSSKSALKQSAPSVVWPVPPAPAPVVAPVKVAQPAPVPSPAARPEESVTAGLPTAETGQAVQRPTRVNLPSAKAVQIRRHVSARGSAARAVPRPTHGRPDKSHASALSAVVLPMEPTQASPTPSETDVLPQAAARAQPPVAAPSSAPTEPPPAVQRPTNTAGSLSPDDF
jgi:serine/threonine-protein kinase